MVIIFLMVFGFIAGMIFLIIYLIRTDFTDSSYIGFPGSRSFDDLDEFGPPGNSGSSDGFSGSGRRNSSRDFYEQLDRGEYDDDPDILREEDYDTYVEDYGMDDDEFDD